MPTKRKPAKKEASKKVATARVTRHESTDATLSYETQMIITILLLLFFYPIGLIFMWAWMGRWPMWVKVILTLPLFLGVLAFISFIIFIAALIRHVGWNYRMEQQRERMMKQYLTPTPTVSQEANTTPLPTSSDTYTY